jgi:hypothetical protein
MAQIAASPKAPGWRFDVIVHIFEGVARRRSDPDSGARAGGSASASIHHYIDLGVFYFAKSTEHACCLPSGLMWMRKLQS